jgi:two-component system chemotaxis response regulator CheY
MKSREYQTMEKPAITPAQARRQPKRILVVDDDNDIRQFSVDILTDSGYDVDGAKDGADGWDALQASNYDLVITDNKMPRMTGMEMIEKLRAAYMTLPVILATRHVPKYELSLRPWLEPDAMLERPFSHEDLLGVVKKFLGPDSGGDEVKVSLLPKYL